MEYNARVAFSPKQNLILGMLPTEDYEKLLPQLHLVELELGHSIYESGGQLEHVYFPVQGIVSLLYVTQGGNSAELVQVLDDRGCTAHGFASGVRHHCSMRARAPCVCSLVNNTPGFFLRPASDR